RLCDRPNANLRDASGKLDPKATLPIKSYVRVLELKADPVAMIRIALLASPNDAAGTELGWTATSNTRELARAARPSEPAAQMAALLAAAKAGRTGGMGGCYHAIKQAIYNAGGYGDILNT